MSSWNSSNSTPRRSPVSRSPTMSPAPAAATSGRAIIIWGTLTRSSPTRVPHSSRASWTSTFIRTPQRHGARGGNVLRGDLDAVRGELPELVRFRVGQVHVAQALLAPGAMVHAADVDLPD